MAQLSFLYNNSKMQYGITMSQKIFRIGMQRITEEEAKAYIACSEDFTEAPAAYYTVTQDDAGWDMITYYTAKRRGVYHGKTGDEMVYVLSNPAMPGLYKIGHTKSDAFNRATQISRGTGVPQDFQVEWCLRCFKAERIERETHRYFKAQRVNRRKEFFRVELDVIQTAIMQIAAKYDELPN
jgi:hypothetical protein